MNLSKQIKQYRERDHLSQEELADKIYVSRQTISNWENERSYPDVHNLLLLSVLFDISLDELVKGDLVIMKNKVEKSKLNSLVCCMLGCMVLTMISIAPAVRFLGLIGLIIPGVFAVTMMILAIVIEKIKKENNLGTYSEILAYMENRAVDPEKVSKERMHQTANMILLVAAVALTAMVLAAASFLLFF